MFRRVFDPHSAAYEHFISDGAPGHGLDHGQKGAVCPPWNRPGEYNQHLLQVHRRDSPTTQGFQLTCRAGRSAAQHRDRSKSSPAGRVDSGLQTGRAT